MPLQAGLPFAFLAGLPELIITLPQFVRQKGETFARPNEPRRLCVAHFAGSLCVIIG